MKKLYFCLIAIVLSACTPIKLMHDDHGRLLYSYGSGDLEWVTEAAASQCANKGKGAAELQAVPVCGGTYCTHMFFCTNSCTATFNCK